MKKTLLIEGMSCQHCVNHVRNALSELAGVNDVAVDLDKQTALLTLDQEISNDLITAAIDEIGYKVVSIKKASK